MKIDREKFKEKSEKIYSYVFCICLVIIFITSYIYSEIKPPIDLISFNEKKYFTIILIINLSLMFGPLLFQIAYYIIKKLYLRVFKNSVLLKILLILTIITGTLGFCITKEYYTGYYVWYVTVADVRDDKLVINRIVNDDTVSYEINKPFLIKVKKGDNIHIKYSKRIGDLKYLIDKEYGVSLLIASGVFFVMMIIFASLIPSVEEKKIVK